MNVEPILKRFIKTHKNLYLKKIPMYDETGKITEIDYNIGFENIGITIVDLRTITDDKMLADYANIDNAIAWQIEFNSELVPKIRTTIFLKKFLKIVFFKKNYNYDYLFKYLKPLNKYTAFWHEYEKFVQKKFSLSLHARHKIQPI